MSCKYCVCLFFSVRDTVTVFIRQQDGKQLAHLVDHNIPVTMNITLGRVNIYDQLHELRKSSELHHSHKSAIMIAVSLGLFGILLIGIMLMLIVIIRRSRYISRRNTHRVVSVDFFILL